jgi:parallel beta-helix repeat protein
MALDFPSNPTLGQSFTSDGAVYTWNGYGWTGGLPISLATPGVSGLMPGADKTKLDGIQPGATANLANSALLARANHTGTQLSNTISDFTPAVTAIVGSSGGSGGMTDAQLLARANHTGTQTAATISDLPAAVNAIVGGGGGMSDAALLSRANHTGTQLAATISDFNAAVAAAGGTGVTLPYLQSSRGLSIKDFLPAAGDNVTDCTAAMNTAHNNNPGAEIYYPPGQYIINGTVQCDGKPFRLRGAGSSVTIFKHYGTGTGAMFAQVQNDIHQIFDLADCRINTNRTFNTNYPAIKITSTATLASAREWSRANIRRLHIEPGTGQFGTGIEFFDCCSTAVDELTVRGVPSNSFANYKGKGIVYSGGGNVPTTFNMINIQMYSLSTGINCTIYLEGLFISHFNFVNVVNGILLNSGCLQADISNGHINCGQVAVQGNNFTQSTISNCLFYVWANSGFPFHHGVSIANSFQTSISNTRVIQLNSGSPNLAGIWMSGCYDNNLIGNNTQVNGSKSMYLEACDTNVLSGNRTKGDLQLTGCTNNVAVAHLGHVVDVGGSGNLVGGITT